MHRHSLGAIGGADIGGADIGGADIHGADLGVMDAPARLTIRKMD